MSKNIQEYVARSIIEHMKYQNEKIKELETLLEELGVEKCINCQKYTSTTICYFCEEETCVNCMILDKNWHHICKTCYKND